MLKRWLHGGLVLAALTTAACGGGGGGGSTTSVVPATAVTPASAASVAALTTGGTLLAASGASGISSSFSLAGSGSVSAAESATQPAGVPALQFTARSGASAQARKPAASANAALVYVTVTAATAASLSAVPAWSSTFASTPAGTLYLAFYTGSAWQTLTGPGTLGGTTVTFGSGTFAAPIALAANGSATFAVYSGGVLGATPSSSPAAAATASPSPGPSSSAGTFVDTACLQTPAPVSNTQTNVAATFFVTTLPTAKTICLSAWDLSSNVTAALVAAAQAGASVTVITPYSENASNAGDIAQIVAAGGHAKTEYTTGSGGGTPTPAIAYALAPMDIHAKFALVNGVAYLDGHNWFSTDVVMQDGYAADFAAIQADLTTFATPAPSGSGVTATFTTDKQLSLDNESNYLQTILNAGIGSANEYDFATESFNPNPTPPYYNDDVYDGMCQIAALASHPTMHVLVESYSGYSSSAQAALQNLMLLDPNAAVHTESTGGLEKLSLLRSTVGGSATSAWFGSSNDTTTDLFDWGIDFGQNSPGMLLALQQWFDAAYPIGGTQENATAIPTASPGVTPAPCATVHP